MHAHTNRHAHACTHACAHACTHPHSMHAVTHIHARAPPPPQEMASAQEAEAGSFGALMHMDNEKLQNVYFRCVPAPSGGCMRGGSNLRIQDVFYRLTVQGFGARGGGAHEGGEATG